MNKKLITGIVLMLVTIGLFSGCISSETELDEKIKVEVVMANGNMYIGEISRHFVVGATTLCIGTEDETYYLGVSQIVSIKVLES